MGRMLVLERIARTLLGIILQFWVFDRLAVFVNQNTHWLAHGFSPCAIFLAEKDISVNRKQYFQQECPKPTIRDG